MGIYTKVADGWLPIVSGTGAAGGSGVVIVRYNI